jgi:hypothetical protein
MRRHRTASANSPAKGKRGPVTADIAFEKALAQRQRHPLRLRLRPGREHGAAQPARSRRLPATGQVAGIDRRRERVLRLRGRRLRDPPVGALWAAPRQHAARRCDRLRPRRRRGGQWAALLGAGHGQRVR